MSFRSRQQFRSNRASTCERCGAKIDFVRHRDTLKRAPLDPGYAENGNLFVEGDFYIVLTGEVREKALARHVRLRINHNATCKALHNRAA